MLSEPILQNIPRNGGVRNAASPWTNIGCQEILKTGNLSRKWSRAPKEPSLTSRFKRSPIRVKALGNS